MSVVLQAQPDAKGEFGSRPLRVAVYLADQNPHRDRSLGITSMTRSLMSDLCTRADLQLTQITSRSSFQVDSTEIQTLQLPFRTDHAVGRLLADSAHKLMVRPNVDLWYYPKGYVGKLPTSMPTIGTMHDTIVQHYADHYPKLRSKRSYNYWIAQTQRSLKQFTRVMTVSQHAAGQLRSFCERYGIQPPRIDVTFEASSWETIRGVEHEKLDQVVHFSSSTPHKRTNRLLLMWKQMQRAGAEHPELILIGKIDSEGQELCRSIKSVRHLPALDTKELQQEVARSRALILPSEIEGFGLPALEAYYVGTPVCYVRETSVAEVVLDPSRRGEFALDDSQSLRTAIDRVLGMSGDEVKEIGDRMYEKFAISKICDRMIDIMRDCVA